MSNNPFEPSNAEISARTAAKFLIDVPTGELPAVIKQIPDAALTKIAASLESYAIRTSLITAYVQAVALGYSREEAAGKSATVSRAVRKALHAITGDTPSTTPPPPPAPGEKNKEEGKRKKGAAGKAAGDQ